MVVLLYYIEIESMLLLDGVSLLQKRLEQNYASLNEDFLRLLP